MFKLGFLLFIIIFYYVIQSPYTIFLVFDVVFHDSLLVYNTFSDLLCCFFFLVFITFISIYFFSNLYSFLPSAVLGFSCTFSRSFSCQVKLFISDYSCFLRSSCMLYISVIGQHFLAKLGEAVKGFIPLCSQCVCVRVCVCVHVCVCVCV